MPGDLDGFGGSVNCFSKSINVGSPGAVDINCILAHKKAAVRGGIGLFLGFELNGRLPQDVVAN